MFRVLFLCTGTSGRSQMAEAFAKRFAPADTLIRSAADNSDPINPVVIELMNELGYSIPDRNEPNLDNAASEPYDVVVTLCEKAHEQCPTFPGSPTRIHWSLTDPVKLTQPSEDPRPYFKRLRDEIRDRTRQFFEHGYFDSIHQMRGTFGAILNNMTDGVMAYDGSGRVFFFNTSAERITGLSFGDVIGQSCASVLPAWFNAADHNCSDDTKHVHVSFTRGKDNQEIILDLTCTQIEIPGKNERGSLIIFRDLTEMMHLRKRLERGLGFEGMIGRDDEMQRIFGTIRELADVNVPVLIQGESGTGKEMVARALHNIGPRSSKPFVVVNCAALPEGTLESELFGHVKGAFTSAIRDKKGYFQQAHTGTIFLDEIAELPQTIQVKLLRVLQDKSFQPVGADKPVQVDVRILCATNRNLKKAIEKGLFREDLFYRLAVVPLDLPALRDRRGDIPLLIDHFRNLHAVETNKPAKAYTRHAMERMIEYDWPGNIRELANAVQYAALRCRGELIDIEHLPEAVQRAREDKQHVRRGPGRPPKSTPDEAQAMLEQMNGDRTRTAQALGISRVTLYRMLKKAKSD